MKRYLPFFALTTIILASSASTLGEPEVTFTITADKSMLLPGESVTLNMWASINPLPGSFVVVPGGVVEVMGYGHKFYDIVSDQSVATGSIWGSGGIKPVNVNDNFWKEPTSGGIPNGNTVQFVDSYNHINKAYTPNASMVIPLWLGKVKWTPKEYIESDVLFSIVANGKAAVWIKNAMGQEFNTLWPLGESQSTMVHVVPAPATLLPLSLALVAGRRRRPDLLPCG